MERREAAMSAGDARPPKLPLETAACAVAARISDAGFETYFAGGCVRDRVLGLPVKDYDIATSARPEDVKDVFPKARGVGEAFGVMLVRHGGHTFEVATFREDGPYHDGRRPSEVRFSTARRDAERRDFTINGLFAVPATGEVIDFVEGRADIAARRIRAIGDAHARIREDRLRMLRAAKFAARLGFEIEPATFEAIRAHAGELASVSPERVGGELRTMLADPNRARAAELIERLGLAHAIFGEVAPADPGATAGLPRLGVVEIGSGDGRQRGGWTTALAAWWLDRTTGDVTAQRIEAATEVVRRRLVLSNEETDGFRSALVIRRELLGGALAARHAHRVRTVARPGFDAALALVWAENPSLGAEFASIADRELPSRSLPAPMLDGAALIAAGHRPGPEFKDWLAAALDAQIEGRISTRDEALGLVERLRGGAPRA
jgi:poly(A) polymerase